MSNGARIPDELARKFGDIEGRRQLMKDYGDKSSMFTGTNQDGEDVSISIAASGIIETVYQGNGRVRIDYYDENGYQTGSKYDGQWN